MRRALCLLIALLILLAPCGVSAEQTKTDLCLLRLTPYIDIFIDHEIPPSVPLAQLLLETGHCSAEVAVKYNNFWGIKCQEWPCFSKRTWEVYAGKYWEGELLFQIFDSPGDAAEAYCKKILYQWEYRNVDRSSRDAYIYTMSKVWATDPEYAKKLRAIIRDYDLGKYDGDEAY